MDELWWWYGKIHVAWDQRKRRINVAKIMKMSSITGVVSTGNAERLMTLLNPQ